VRTLRTLTTMLAVLWLWLGAGAMTPARAADTKPAAAPAAQVTLSVPCTEACAAAKAASASEATPPAWAASSAAVTDHLRQAEFELRQQLLMRTSALALVLGGAAALLALVSALQARQGDGWRITSHWGGFGDATGGWQVSPACASLLAAAVLAMAAVTTGVAVSAVSIETPAPGAAGGK